MVFLPTHPALAVGPHLSFSLERLATIFDYLEAKDMRMHWIGFGPSLYSGQAEESGAALTALGARTRAAGR